jgi:hypothetical protein
LLRLQSEQADWNNRLLSSQVPAAEQAAGGASSLLSGFQANPPGGPADGGSGVASTVTNLAVNPNIPPGATGIGPSARGVVNTAGMSPYAKYVANEVLAGRMSPEALTQAVNLGQSATLGPGHTYADTAAVERARQMPITRTVGQETILNPPAAAQGSGVVPGMSPVQVALDKSTGDQAALAIAQKPDAMTHLSELDKINDLYDQVATGDPSQIVPDEVLKALSARFGVNFRRMSTYADMQAEIGARLRSMVTTARDAAADPAARGVYQTMLGNLPDPSAAPASFHRQTAYMARQLQMLIDDGTTAEKFGASPGNHSDVVSYRNAVDQNHAKAAVDLAKLREPIETSPPPSPTSTPVSSATPRSAPLPAPGTRPVNPALPPAPTPAPTQPRKFRWNPHTNQAEPY